MTMAILRIDDVCKSFSGLQVLYGVNLEVLEGERHAIIGPNGAGKTTLFNIITGLSKPSRGRVFFMEKDVTSFSIHRIARMGLSLSFQIINIFPKMTVYENVRNAIISRFGRRFNWITLLYRDTKIEKESCQILDRFGLTNVREVPASELSYGRQRQLELALALALDPVLVMLDEPTAGLNTEETRKAIQLIREVTAGKTLMIIEHDMEVVFNIADRITVLNHGKVLLTGTPSTVRESEEVQQAYLRRK